jgi:hypothetical protein
LAVLDRRSFVGLSAAGLSTIALPSVLRAQTPQCVTGPLPPFLPTTLSVDCASKRNFRLFRTAPDKIGLAACVSMTFVRGGARGSSYNAGNLFLYPWLKPAGQGMSVSASSPVTATTYTNAAPIPDWTLPLDEYFLNYVIKVPSLTSFIGFRVDAPFSALEATLDWFTNTDQLADGQGVGIEWTSCNLNAPWFGGSNFIPNADTCQGLAWRNLVVAGLRQASTATC